MKSANIQYLPGVDHLRGVAALLIVLYHGVQLYSHRLLYGAPFDPGKWPETRNPLWTPVVEGHTAVALFMVLSGFIFTYGARDSELVYGKFLRNRVLRIFPLYLTLLFVGAYTYRDRFTPGGLFQTLFLLENLPGRLNAGPFSEMFWTITVEFQFYLLFPFLLLFARRYGARYLLGLIALFTVFRAMAYLSGAEVRDVAYWTLVGRLDQFALGMLAGLAYARQQGSRGPAAAAAGLPGLWRFLAAGLLTMASLHVFHVGGGWPRTGAHWIFWPTWEGTCWAAVILTYLPLSARVPGGLSRALCAVGTLSYSIYLLHYVLLSLSAERGIYLTGLPFSPLVSALLNAGLVLLPVTLLVSAMTYHLIEKPFLELRVRYRKESDAAVPHAAVPAESA